MKSLVGKFALMALLTTAVCAAEPTEREIKGTELIVQAELDALQAPPADVSYQRSDKLATAFPGYLFVLASFAEADIAALPKPLAPRNLYAVAPDGQARLLATAEDVLELFKDAFAPIKTAEDAKKAVEAALALEAAKFPEQEFTPPTGLQARPDGKGGFQASGGIEPTARQKRPSGAGAISANLDFDPNGRPENVDTNNDYRPPARRRSVTPADIAADEPAAQQAAGGPVTNINSPTINRILPGSSFFAPKASGASSSSSNTGSNTSGKNKAGVVAVDPAGKTSKLADTLQLAKYTRQQYGKVTNKQQAREVMEAYLTLATGNWPNKKFDPIEDNDITVTKNSDGSLTVVGQVNVKGSNDKQFHKATWNFGANGRFTGGFRNSRGLKG